MSTLADGFMNVDGHSVPSVMGRWKSKRSFGWMNTILTLGRPQEDNGQPRGVGKGLPGQNGTGRRTAQDKGVEGRESASLEGPLPSGP